MCIRDRYNADPSSIKILASNEINEEVLLNLKQRGHEIDYLGIGTHLVTCQKQPSLGMVYKLVEAEGTIKMKLSEDIDKMTLPGKKNLYRLYTKDSKFPSLDVITLFDEVIEEGEPFEARDAKRMEKKYQVTPYKVLPLLHQVWDGKSTYQFEELATKRARVIESLKTFNPDVLELQKPKRYPILFSKKYHEIMIATYERALVVESI
eukprot:TRINITY_DN3757_c0_g1_i2.p1 TRINITY_DN3757_c0_g1~~TRINITY_DN3757_c0_g1_i2.p1  ORF type:complete len:235 (-),score=69.04 TRINITY_DN3757_c0_g1_i2:182-802(-)